MNARSYTTPVHGDPDNKRPFNLDRIVRLVFAVGLIAAIWPYYMYFSGDIHFSLEEKKAEAASLSASGGTPPSPPLSILKAPLCILIAYFYAFIVLIGLHSYL